MLFKLLKRPFFGNYMVKWKNPLNLEEQGEWTEFYCESGSGGTLKGIRANAKTEQALASILLAHPMGKEAKAYFLKRGYAEFLRSAGYNVIAFDFNGFGESSHGSFSYFKDVVSMSICAKEIYPHLPLGYHGISLGAMWGTVALADSTHKIDFAIIESSAINLKTFWSQFPYAAKVLSVMSILLPRYRQEVEMIDRIKDAKNLRSVLFIYSKSDKWVSVSDGLQFKENCGVPAVLWISEHAEHAEMMRSTDQEAYQNEILKYFKRQCEEIGSTG